MCGRSEYVSFIIQINTQHAVSRARVRYRCQGERRDPGAAILASVPPALTFCPRARKYLSRLPLLLPAPPPCPSVLRQS
jgi:hypothetical protein